MIDFVRISWLSFIRNMLNSHCLAYIWLRNISSSLHHTPSPSPLSTMRLASATLLGTSAFLCSTPIPWENTSIPNTKYQWILNSVSRISW